VAEKEQSSGGSKMKIYKIEVKVNAFPYDMLRHDNGMIVQIKTDKENNSIAIVESERYHQLRWLSFGAITTILEERTVWKREHDEFVKKANEWLVKESLKRPEEVLTEWFAGTKYELHYEVRRIVEQSDDVELKEMYRKATKAWMV
jgi:hypothetical protein